MDVSVLKVALGVVVAAFVIGAAILAVLPGTRIATASHVLPFPVDEVFEIYSTPEQQADWREDVSMVKMDTAAERKAWTEVPQRGPAMRFEVVEAVRNTKLALQFGADGLFAGEYEASFEPVGGGTRVTATEQVSLLSPVAKAMSYVFVDLDDEIAKFAREAEVELERRRGT